MSAATTVRWIKVSEAMTILGVGRRAVDNLVKAGNLTIRRLPGAPPKVRKDEVLAVAAQFTKPARSEAPSAE